MKRRPIPTTGAWRAEPSPVTAIKEAYRQASRRQRYHLRAYFARVLANLDGAP